MFVCRWTRLWTLFEAPWGMSQMLWNQFLTVWLKEWPKSQTIWGVCLRDWARTSNSPYLRHEYTFYATDIVRWVRWTNLLCVRQSFHYTACCILTLAHLISSYNPGEQKQKCYQTLVSCWSGALGIKFNMCFYQQNLIETETLGNVLNLIKNLNESLLLHLTNSLHTDVVFKYQLF